ncbi:MULTISPECIES: Holliday junction resolvase RuvX [Bremerella]|uniref:Holliday junction resolvase RuvX n=1 Tax=Bremerella TaxID=2714594 RepID=UPI0031EC3655
MSNQLPSIPDKGRIAAVDYGTVRIGIAITDPERVLSSPLENYNRRSPSKDAQYFKELAELERVVMFVVGLPVHMSGDESQKSFEARQFGKWLFETTGVPVTFYDERFTTSMAKDLLQGAGLTKKRRKARLDMLSAQILLTAFLENPERALGSVSGLED